MSEFIFGVTSKRHDAAISDRLDAICRAEGGNAFVRYSAPGTDVKGWFTGPNMGHPFDTALAARVIAAVVAAGIEYYDP
jgi:hypothetical protein